MMDLLKKAILAISAGEVRFSAGGNTKEELRKFQPFAQAILHAEREGLIGEVKAISNHQLGENLLSLVFVTSGLTYLGAARAAQWNNEMPCDELVTQEIAGFGYMSVQEAWQKALDRRKNDPAGAITSARALLESVLKHVLDARSVTYDAAKIDLHELYKLASTELQLAVEKQQEEAVKKILGGCSAIVSGVGVLRNRAGDAHGGGKNSILPDSELAELAVNVAGCMAAFVAKIALKNK